MGDNYASTEVPVARSQDELRNLLVRFGAEQFSFGQGPDWAGLEFVHEDHLVRFRAPLGAYDEAKARRPHKTRLTPATWPEAEARRVWRVLVWSVKARLVAVDENLESFEQAFLAQMVDPSTNKTIWQNVRELVETGALRQGGPGLRAIGPAQ